MSHSFKDLQDGFPSPDRDPEPTPEDSEAVEAFLADLADDFARIDERARTMQGLVVDRATEAVEAGKGLHPVVMALVAGNTQLYFPHWHSALEKERIFAQLNEKLGGASATVTAVPAHWTPEPSDAADLREDPQALPAIIVITRTPQWKQTFVLPYTETPRGIDWSEPVVMDDFESGLLQVPQVN